MSVRTPPLKQLRHLAKTRWVNLLRGQLNVHGVRAPELVEEYRFLERRLYRFDFAVPAARIGIEVEGGVFGRGKSRHTSGAGFQEDCRKYNAAALEGWMVLRFTSPMIENGEAVQAVCVGILQRAGTAGSREEPKQGPAS